MRLLLCALLGTALLTTACQKDSTAPYLDFINTGTALTGDRTAAAADTFEVRLFAESRRDEPALKKLSITAYEVYRDINSVPVPDPEPLVYFDTLFTGATLPRAFLLTSRFGASTNAGYQDWTYTLTDEEGQTSRRRIRVAVLPADSSSVMHTYSVRLQAPRRADSRATLSALRGFVLPGHAVRQAGYQRLVDFVYVPTPTGPSLAAPSSPAAARASWLRVGTWPTRRATRLAATAIAATAFDGFNTSTSLTTALNAIAASAYTDHLPVAKGNVLAFETADGRKGLLLVRDLGATAPVDLALSVKVLRR